MRRNFLQKLKHWFFSAGVLIFPLLFSASAQHSSKTFIVRRGDTVSYLAVRYYGFFSDSLFTVLKTANAHIADLNRIYPGDKLYFPLRPSAEPRLEQLRTAAAQAVLTFYEGPVRYRRAGRDQNSAFTPAEPNLFLGPGDEIETHVRARAELVLDNRSVIRLAPNSHLKINALSRPEPANATAQPLQAQFDFSLGSLWTRVTKIFDRQPKVDVKFPTAIAGVQGTSYRAMVAADSTTNVRVYEGAVEVRGGGSLTKPQPVGPPRRIEPPQQVPGPQQIPLEAWVQLVRAQQQITVARDGRPSTPSPFTDRGADLDWVKWNQQRDRDLDAER
ncbi:MAG: FecR domain-containing protein [candidate division KSB1 bacterium]|nr:FecR domain-containing protein [candidate division KSB1 bacterium]